MAALLAALELLTAQYMTWAAAVARVKLEIQMLQVMAVMEPHPVFLARL
jgi:hypothetical protein